jgi:branched-chain amino acid aminotransferase
MQISTTTNPTPVDEARLAEIHANPGFGQHFTDHMLTVEWTPDAGWHAARIEPYGPLTLDPATAVLHYAQETFEGMKAYRHDDGSVWTFRPDQNAARMVRSSQRLAFPELPVDDFVELVDALVTVDHRWVPDNSSGGGEKSLYLRPFMFASETFLGVRPAQHVTFMVIASPAGAYFKGGIKPVNLWLSETFTRAGRGGMGAAKTGGNEELGGMNLFFVHRDGSIVTPETGTILEGITRASIIELAGKLGHAVEERKFSLDEWRDGVASGEITEIFACGTAAVVTPVGELRSPSSVTAAPASTELTMQIRDALVGMQFGRSEDTFGWMHQVC